MTQESDEALGGLLNMEAQLSASLAVGSSVEYPNNIINYCFIFFIFSFLFDQKKI